MSADSFPPNTICPLGETTSPALGLSAFDYTLPAELIAQTPPKVRGESRLLVPQSHGILDTSFAQLSAQLKPNDLLVLNNTKVIPARFAGRKHTGGAIELLLERVLGPRELLVQMRASHAPKPGSRNFDLLAPDAPLDSPAQASAKVTRREGQFYVIELDCDALALLEKIGRLPLPPYIERAPDAADDERYQTVYARETGAVAAPTAGLHFTDQHLTELTQQGIQLAYVTLHVGAGTFAPVRTENLDEHQMHSEFFKIDDACAKSIENTKLTGGRVIAVGTTSLRALESSAAHHGKVQAGEMDTRLFIRPGYQFHVVDALVTNFHLPKSTLMMLVSAFAGVQEIRQIYAHAIQQKYRFFSYGDAMFLNRKNDHA